MGKKDKHIFTIQDLAQKVGVSTSSLRAWERRYGFFDPLRTAGDHRLYSRDDLMLYWYVVHSKSNTRNLKDIAQNTRTELLQMAHNYFYCSILNEWDGVVDPTRSSFEKIFQALRNYEFKTALEMIDQLEMIAESPIDFCDAALSMLNRLGNDWQNGHISIAAEHVFSAKIKQIILNYVMNPKNPQDQRSGTALLATLPGEYHELGLLRIGVCLVDWGWNVYYVGVNTPLNDILACANAVKPNMACLSFSSANNPKLNDRQLFELDANNKRRVPLVCGGAGITAIQEIGTVFKNVHFIENLVTFKSLCNEMLVEPEGHQYSH